MARRSVHEIERLRRSLAMLTPGQVGLSREDAMTVLDELGQVSRELHRLQDGLRALLDEAP